MTIVQFPKQKTDEELWDDFLDLKTIALATEELDDALKARKAFQDFLESQNG